MELNLVFKTDRAPMLTMETLFQVFA